MNKKIRKLKVWSRIAARLACNPFKLNASLEDFRFLSDRETIEYIKNSNVGIVRYGDGELNYTVGYPAVHQTQNATLKRKLTNVLAGYAGPKTYLLAVPLDLLLTKNYAERNSTPENWRAPKYAALPLLKKGAVYGSPFCFRLQDVIDDNPEEYKELVLSLFKERDVIYVGSGQDVAKHISPATSIPIPSHNTYKYYHTLLKKITNEANQFKNPLIAISGGVTATILAAELNEKGILAYDTGSLFGHLKL
ncbi:MAG: GT-D fold domain-containing glycosyltransferase [Candidatus Paceibacterota bacterium]